MLLVIGDEGNVDHILFAADTGEAFGMERLSGNFDNFAGDFIAAFGTLFTLLLEAELAKDLIVVGKVCPGYALATAVTLFRMLLKEVMM